MKSYRRIRLPGYITAIGLLAIMMTGCLKNDWEEREKQEKKELKAYLDANEITEADKTDGGIYFLEEDTGYGLSPVKDDYIYINYVGKYLNGEIHETSYDSLKDEWTNALLYYKYFVYGPLKIKCGYSIAGLNEGLSLMREGGKATMIIPSDKAFFDFKSMVYEVELLKVIKGDPGAYEDSILIEYLLANDYDTTKPPNNVYILDTISTDTLDEVIDINDTVLLRFTGRLIDSYDASFHDNRVFDSNLDDTKPLKIVYGQNDTEEGFIMAMPDGFTAALDSMREGTHATVVLPYQQAFGAEGFFHPTYGYIIVPQYQTIAYDLEIEDIRPPEVK